MIVYLDTSALTKRVVGEEGEDLVHGVLKAADVVLSSHLIYPEARAAAAAASRARRLGAVRSERAAAEIQGLCQTMELIHLDGQVGRLAGDLAQGHSLRGADAVHLATAVGVPVRRVVVATWDRDLARAATANGLGVIPAQQEPIQPGELVVR